jgi:hypothetical protein
MPAFQLPLSGNVTQSINPWTVLFNPWGNQVGLININLGLSANPPVEEEVLTDVASYGRQLGRMQDVMVVLLKHFHPAEPLSFDDEKAIGDLKTMLTAIAQVKAKHSAQTSPAATSI